MSDLQQRQSLPLVIAPAQVSSNLRHLTSHVRCATVCFLSMIVPGAGQLALGYRRRGLVMVGLSALIIAGMVVAVPQDPFEALALAVQPSVLISVMIANVGLLAFRAVAVFDAYRLASSSGHPNPKRTSLVPAMLLMLVLSLTAAPHAVIAYYDVTTYRLVDRVFNSTPAPNPAGQPTEVQLTREINLKPGVTPAAAPVTEELPGE